MADAYRSGDYVAAGMMAANLAVFLVAALSQCGILARFGPELGAVANYGLLGAGLAGAAGNIYHGVQGLLDPNADHVMAWLDLLQGAVDLYYVAKFASSACFAAGTKLLTQRGWVAIEEIVVGDYVWSKPEHDPDAPGAWKRVDALLIRTAEIWNLHVGGQIIRTTKEHPFWVGQTARWIAGEALREGDVLSGHEGQMPVVEGIADSGETGTVYNVVVADWHTYFVGDEEWGFSVWSHNACSSTSGETEAASNGRAAHKAFNWGEGFEKEVALPSGKRADAVNWETQTVGELKPANPRAVSRGQNQLRGYAKELEEMTGAPWNKRLETY